MVKLLRCEFWKLKRRRFVTLAALSALLFPIPLTYLMLNPAMMERYPNKIENFDGLFNMSIGYGVMFLLPCILGIVAVILFFMERDSDTFKNLRTIPVSSTQMVLVKVAVLFLFSVFFCVVTTAVTVLCGYAGLGIINGVASKLLIAVEAGILITAGTLPLVVIIVLFSKTYIFSVLLCIFYSVLSLCAMSVYDVVPLFTEWMPIPMITLWSAKTMVKYGMDLSLKEMDALIPSDLKVVLAMGIVTIVSVVLIDWIYRRRGD